MDVWIHVLLLLWIIVFGKKHHRCPWLHIIMSFWNRLCQSYFYVRWLVVFHSFPPIMHACMPWWGGGGCGGIVCRIISVVLSLLISCLAGSPRNLLFSQQPHIIIIAFHSLLFSSWCSRVQLAVDTPAAAWTGSLYYIGLACLCEFSLLQFCSIPCYDVSLRGCGNFLTTIHHTGTSPLVVRKPKIIMRQSLSCFGDHHLHLKHARSFWWIVSYSQALFSVTPAAEREPVHSLS